MKRFFEEEMSMDELRGLVAKLKNKGRDKTAMTVAIVLGVVAIAGIVAWIVVKLCGNHCECGCDCDDDCDCGCDENGCCFTDEDDFIDDEDDEDLEI